MVSPYAQYIMNLSAEELAQNDVIVTTVTFYRPGIDDLRFNLACKTVELATAAGYPVVVIDGSPDPEVKRAFSERGAHVFSEETRDGRPLGLGAAKRQSFYHAIRRGTCDDYRNIMVHMEAEKHDMVRWIPLLIYKMTRGNVDVVVATRTDKSLDNTYPTFQAETERQANQGFWGHVGLNLDIMFGPGAFNSRTAGYFFTDSCSYLVTGVPDTYAQHYSAISAHAHGLNVIASDPLDFIYPPEQKKQEEDEIAAGGNIKQKRLDQRDTLIKAYVALAKHFNLPRK
jgi:hypothetical protein